MKSPLDTTYTVSSVVFADKDATINLDIVDHKKYITSEDVNSIKASINTNLVAFDQFTNDATDAIGYISGTIGTSLELATIIAKTQQIGAMIGHGTGGGSSDQPLIDGDEPVQTSVDYEYLNGRLALKQDKITSTNKLSYSLIEGTPTIPTKVSQLTNDKGYITASSIPTIPTVNNRTITIKQGRRDQGIFHYEFRE